MRPPSGAEEASYTIKENDDEDDTNLIKPGGASAVVADLTGLITDPEGGTITYSVKGDGDVGGSAAPFGVVDGSSLVVDMAIPNATAAVADDADTDTDESTDAIPPNGGTCMDDTAADGCGNIQYVFEVNASDGVTSNDQVVEVTVIVDVNDPAAEVAADSLPGDVMAGMIDHDDDAATDMVEGLTLAISVPEKDVPITLFNLGDLFSDADSDDLDFVLTGNPSHVVWDSSTDNVLLTYMPPDADPGPRVDVVTITADDGYNSETDADDEDVPDATLMIEISITELPPDPITSSFVGISVEEVTGTCTADDGGACTVAGAVAGGVAYSIESGVDGGDTDYAVDASDGAISVVNIPDYEDDQSPAFLVNVQNDLGELAGLVSVRVSITDVDEDPTIDCCGYGHSSALGL